MIRSVLLALFFIVVTISPMLSQSWMPVIRDVHGDSIPYKFPVADSLYIHNKIVIKFKEGALNKDLLCYTCSSNENLLKVYNTQSYELTLPCKQELLSQQFPVDSGILVSSTLAGALKSIGGTYLRRMTWANPCVDTLSKTRLGDTIRIDHHNWMVLELNNDTSAVLASIVLNLLYRQYVDVADLNYLYDPCTKDPWDYYYHFDAKQVSITGDLIGMPTAWEYEVGNHEVRVAIVDVDGVDYRHCDLGGDGTDDFPTDKVVGGFNFTYPNLHIYEGDNHGTVIAGIIGGLTNSDGNCGQANPKSIAGIAGGWGTLNNATPDGIGVSLLGYRCMDNNYQGSVSVAHAISAILISSGHSVNGHYGDKVDIINTSWDKPDSPPSEALRRAVYEAYRHQVSFVAARGNYGNSANVTYRTDPAYPACFDGNWVVSVGWAKRNKTRSIYGTFEKLVDVAMNGRLGVLDLIAPGGDIDRSSTDNTVFTTDQCDPPLYNKFDNFEGSSAAAPHVSGVIALMRSTVQDAPNFFSLPGTQLEPEDYEGILQATAQRDPFSQGSSYLEQRGWGHLQADKVYTKCAIDGFRAKHYSITDDNDFDIGQWIPIKDYHFNTGFNKDWTEIAEKYVANGFIREIRGIYTLSESDWVTSNLFVWGRGGTDGTGGYNAANPNHQYSWTEITNGTGNIGSADPIAPSPYRYVPGIFHNNNVEIECRTYQFKYNNGLTDVKLPADDKIAFHFTVFGKPTTSSVKLSNDTPAQSEMTIQPNPAIDQLTIKYSLTAHSIVSIEIVDVLGKNVIKPIAENNTIGTYSEQIDISNLANGVYYCKLTLPVGKILVQPFMVGIGK